MFKWFWTIFSLGAPETLVFCVIHSCRWNILLQSAVCKAGLLATFYHLRNISRIKKYISRHTAEMLVHAFITSRLDFCISLPYGQPKQTIKILQHVQNVAARILSPTRIHEHFSPVLQEMHQFPIEERITFGILLMTFKGLNVLAPSYLSDLVTRYIPRRLLDVRYNLRNCGFRSFPAASPQLWNDMPLEIRSCESF